MADTNFVIIAMDNNQRGQRKKQQREGASNMFIVVTHSMGIKPLPARVLPKDTSSSVSRYVKQTVTYLNQ